MFKLPPLTISLYIVRQFIISCLMVFAVFTVLIILVDTVETLRRTFSKDVSLWIMLQMVFMKFPLMLQKITPFVMLVGSVLTLTRLTKNQELIIARSAGLSVWQILSPLVIAAFLFGLFMITIFNPLACVMISRYEFLEGKYLKGQISSLAISSTGLWLRQKNDSSNVEGAGESVIHALRAGQKDGELYDVTIFIFADKDRFVRRIDAKKAKLANDFWRLSDVIITSPQKPALREKEYFLETELTLNQIHDSFSPPESISFWELSGFIDTLQQAGFSAIRHRLHWHSILSSPLFYSAMVFIAAIFSMRPPRNSRTGLLVTSSIMAGFMIYFMTDLVSALGLSGTLPIFLAAWTPVFITTLIGVASLLHLEDG
jgi:lipopolysaccharide export system permease protein